MIGEHLRDIPLEINNVDKGIRSVVRVTIYKRSAMINPRILVSRNVVKLFAVRGCHFHEI